MTRMAVAALGLVVLASVAHGQENPAGTNPPVRTLRGVFERSVLEVQSGKKAITRIDLDNRLGDVSIEGHDGDQLIISVLKRARDDDTLDRLKVTVFSEPSGVVRVSTRIAEGAAGTDALPIPKGSVRVDLVVHAPRSAHVTAEGWNDRLEVTGVDNGAQLTTNDGDIAVMNVSGTVETQSAAGKQNFVDVFGAVDAQAVAGDLDLVTVRGKRLHASAHRGTILARQIRVEEMSLRTTIGDIRVQGFAMAGGRYRIASYRGNIEVKLGHGAPLSVSARSGGRVTLPGKLGTRADERDAVVGLLPAAMPEQKDAPTAVVELRSRVGNIQLSVIAE